MISSYLRFDIRLASYLTTVLMILSQSLSWESRKLLEQFIFLCQYVLEQYITNIFIGVKIKNEYSKTSIDSSEPIYTPCFLHLDIKIVKMQSVGYVCYYISLVVNYIATDKSYAFVFKL